MRATQEIYKKKRAPKNKDQESHLLSNKRTRLVAAEKGDGIGGGVAGEGVGGVVLQDWNWLGFRFGPRHHQRPRLLLWPCRATRCQRVPWRNPFPLFFSFLFYFTGYQLHFTNHSELYFIEFRFQLLQIHLWFFILVYSASDQSFRPFH